MRHWRFTGILLTALVMAACVTINVYFPAAQAQQAADRIIRDVYGTPKGKAPPPAESAPAKPAPAPKASPQGRLERPVWVAGLEWLVTPAQAAPNLSVNTPTVRRLEASMKQLHARLVPYFRSGIVGLTADGRIQIRDLNAVPLEKRHFVRRLVSEQNHARDALYHEIARVNGHPDWEPKIRAIFARRWIDNAPAGWWYQDKSGKWRRK